MKFEENLNFHEASVIKEYLEKIGAAILAAYGDARTKSLNCRINIEIHDTGKSYSDW